MTSIILTSITHVIELSCVQLVRLMPATALKAAGVSASGPLLEGGLPRAGVTYMSRFEVDAAGKLPVG